MSATAFPTIAAAAREIAAGRLSPVALVDQCLDRVECIDGGLNSFITVTANAARAAARQAEAELRGGYRRGPLHGVPVGLKDIYETAGVRTTAHSHVLAEHVPVADAETVARLKTAGAVILGKLATHEFANGAPTPDQPFPPARNPWNRELQPGGSSSGSGAAVAAGLCLGALGSDTGGSIRNPAGYCGIAGLKPTYGLVSRRGVLPLAFSLDTAGPMAWTVEDCALLLDAIAGHDPGDPASARTQHIDHAAAAERGVRNMRIGLVRHWYDGPEGAAPEVTSAIDAACAVFRTLGATVSEVELPDLRDYHLCGRILISCEAHAVHRRNLIEQPQRYGYTTRARLQLGAFLSAEEYVAAQRLRRRLQLETRDAMRGFDLLMTANQWGSPERFENPPMFHFLGKPQLTMPFNVTGQPALSLCCGFGADGMPLALQLAGRPFADATVLAAGVAYERATPWRERRPPG